MYDTYDFSETLVKLLITYRVQFMHDFVNSVACEGFG